MQNQSTFNTTAHLSQHAFLLYYSYFNTDTT